jgi:hypothetical protein
MSALMRAPGEVMVTAAMPQGTHGVKAVPSPATCRWLFCAGADRTNHVKKVTHHGFP